MTSKKEELITLINELAEEKVQPVLDFSRTLTDPENMPASENALNELLLTFVSTFTNTLYDISVESEKTGGKVLANRLTISRKKILQAWQNYSISQSKD